jgi:NADPH:quinone reductase-like Zn-dependent oxidoreductase
MKMMTGRTFPRAMGMDFSGTVLSIGPRVTRLKPGDEVFGLARLKESGAFAEALITNENFLAVKPPDKERYPRSRNSLLREWQVLLAIRLDE